VILKWILIKKVRGSAGSRQAPVTDSFEHGERNRINSRLYERLSASKERISPLDIVLGCQFVLPHRLQSDCFLY
jgi:hypothetical protein